VQHHEKLLRESAARADALLLGLSEEFGLSSLATGLRRRPKEMMDVGMAGKERAVLGTEGMD
jgi:hypothetical protein